MKTLLALICALFISGVTFAADGDLFGVESNAGHQVRIDENGKLYGQKVTAEVITTSDTITAAESGKVFLYDPASTQTTVTLPTAAEGLVFTFKQVDGNANSLQKLVIDPQSTDTLVGCVNASTTSTFAAGDSLISTTATGDSVTLVGASLKWYCIDREGTWVDNN